MLSKCLLISKCLFSFLISHIFSSSILLLFSPNFYLLIFRERGREIDRERHQFVAPLIDAFIG